ncbi:hypothetical protein HMPREF9371_2419 [Neisseria shayeganii 871]|uniref:Uncharacterized protein n=1 Tax=Neisseria shayeganii 871 TaxID=1032488 RepID=G4CLC8_9NEIS|nr:hypothetical protein HMPREF9371_2419 [Neisseria shayeganii 871]
MIASIATKALGYESAGGGLEIRLSGMNLFTISVKAVLLIKTAGATA